VHSRLKKASKRLSRQIIPQPGLDGQLRSGGAMSQTIVWISQGSETVSEAPYSARYTECSGTRELQALSFHAAYAPREGCQKQDFQEFSDAFPAAV
jgi:hypothetical protein